MKFTFSLLLGLLVCTGANAQKVSAKVLASTVNSSYRGDAAVHCSADGTDCTVTDTSGTGVLGAVMTPTGYSASAYVRIGLADHRLVTLTCEPGQTAFSKKFCAAPPKDSTVQAEFNGKHATLRWDVETEKIVSVDKTEKKIEHRSEKYTIIGADKDRYSGGV